MNWYAQEIIRQMEDFYKPRKVTTETTSTGPVAMQGQNMTGDLSNLLQILYFSGLFNKGQQQAAGGGANPYSAGFNLSPYSAQGVGGGPMTMNYVPYTSTFGGANPLTADALMKMLSGMGGFPQLT